MSISFSCGQCGKSFTVDDKFAGKQGRCKQCGSVMPIPGIGTAPAREVAREVSPSRRAPVAASPSPREDVYGFEDAPLPPRSALTGGSDSPGEAATAVRPRNKKKKAFGFFASSQKKKKSLYDGGPTLGMAFGRVVIGIVAGIGGLLASSLGLPGVRQMLIPGWSSQSQVEAFVKNHLQYTKNLTAIIQGVTDVPSAQSSSARANAAVRKLKENLLANKDRKGNQKEIDAIRDKYKFSTQNAVQEFMNEMVRVASIPGVLDALAMEGALKELADVEASIPGVNAGMPDFTPPRFRPPPMPTMPPPMNPTLPGFNPGAQPPRGPRPPFGGRRPGGGNPGGPPG